MSDFNRDIARAINIEASALFGLSDSDQLWRGNKVGNKIIKLVTNHVSG